jgi:pimeloyl-ACP methyl ester carboxylesterase
MLLLEKMLKMNNFRCRAILNEVPGIPVVFLHGYSFTSEIWNEIGVLRFLEEENIPFLALDMPYGMKSDCLPKDPNSDVNVKVVRDALHHIFGDELVIVGASLGGYMALKYAVRHPIKGLLLIAPVRTKEETLIHTYNILKTPVSIIYGTKDNLVSLDEMEELEDRLANSKLIIYENASHPAYLYNPENFKKDLIKLYYEAG